MKADPALCSKLSIDAHGDFQSAEWHLSFSLGLGVLSNIPR